jgi:hypothetical protein
MGFGLCNRFMKFQKSIGTPVPKMGVHLGVWMFILTLSHTPKLLSWPAFLQTLVLVANPRLGLRQRSSEYLYPKFFQNHNNNNNLWKSLCIIINVNYRKQKTSFKTYIYIFPLLLSLKLSKCASLFKVMKFFDELYLLHKSM